MGKDRRRDPWRRDYRPDRVLLLNSTPGEMALLGALIAGPPTINRHALCREFCRRIGWLKPDSGLKDMDGSGDDADRPHQVELLREKGASRWIFGPHREMDVNRRFTFKSLSA